MADAQLIEVRFPTKRYVLVSARAEGSSLSLFFPTPVPAAIGAPVRLKVSFGDAPEVFELEGHVNFQRGNTWGIGAERGLGVSFTGEDKRLAAQMFAFCAGKPLNLGTSSRRRVPTKIRCRIRANGKSLKAEVRDLSTGGAFIAGPVTKDLRVGSDLEIQLEPGWFGLGGKKLDLRVLWHGEKGGSPGFGGRFLGDQVRIAPLLKRYLEATGIAG